MPDRVETCIRYVVAGGKAVFYPTDMAARSLRVDERLASDQDNIQNTARPV